MAFFDFFITRSCGAEAQFIISRPVLREFLIFEMGNRPAKEFFLCPFPFSLQSADSRSLAGPCSAPRFRHLRSPADQGDQAIQGVATVSFLGAEPPRIDNEDTVCGNPFASQTKQTLPDPIGNAG